MPGKYSRTKPNDGEHIKDILSRTTCERHEVPVGVPCFHIRWDSKPGYGPGICNSRVVKAGYNGTITPSSSTPKRPNGSRPERRTS